MKKKELIVPKDITYLSEWKELWNILPTNQHYILNKRICGCGATEAYIGSDKKVILASPRKHLLYNKYSQHLRDNLHLYRFTGDKKKYFESKTASASDILTYKKNLNQYIRTGGTKILTTYDSLRKIMEVLSACGENLSQWVVVIDEFQAIFYDCQYKAVTEYELYKVLQKFSTVVYLSATPYLESYLDMTAQFKDHTMYELLWPNEKTQIPDVLVIKSKRSVLNLCSDLIEKYRLGNGESTMVDGEVFVSKEAVFYINSVSEIKKIIKKNNLKPEEITIICSSKSENIKKLDDLSRETGMSFKIGDIPERGAKHKMFTFCTSTVYIGADFYSTNAYSYVFANPQVSCMTVDVSLDLQQIVGRQRLEENPFRNSATLYFNTKKAKLTREELESSIRQKKEKTERQIENYNAAPNKEDLLQLMENGIKTQGHKEHYCCIIKDADNNVHVVDNEILEIADRRAWELSDHIYNSDFSMYRALRAGVNVSRAVDSTDPDIQRIFADWTKDRSFSRKAKMYCALYNSDRQELLEECYFIERKYRDYYQAFGQEGFEALYWREDYIRQALAPRPFDELPKNEIARRLITELIEGREYTKMKVKEILQDIYQDLGIAGKPCACDISSYLSCKDKTSRVDGQKVAIFSIESHLRKKVSLFKQITDVRNPQEYEVDKLLDIIRDNSYFHLKEKVEAVRKSGSKQEKDKKKAALPIVTWNGTFKSKNKNEGVLYSSFTALDFDHIAPKDMPTFAKWLQGFSCVYAYFVTPSGTGYKAIILHDNYEPLYHYDLYGQLVKLFDCLQIDTSTTDLARGNFLSYDPELWKNLNPVPFHFVPSTQEPVVVDTATETVIKNAAGDTILVQDESWVEGFLNLLSRQITSDESIIRMLRKGWTGKVRSRGRNNAAMAYAGILCKAGVEQGKAKLFIEELIPDFDVTQIVGYAYTHNIFGCERRRYKSRK